MLPAETYVPRSLVFSDADRCAQAIVDKVGHDLRLAVPMSIGKPILIVDALYRLAESDHRVQLTIFTGLTLLAPVVVGDSVRSAASRPPLLRLCRAALCGGGPTRMVACKHPGPRILFAGRSVPGEQAGTGELHQHQLFPGGAAPRESRDECVCPARRASSERSTCEPERQSRRYARYAALYRRATRSQADGVRRRAQRESPLHAGRGGDRARTDRHGAGARRSALSTVCS